jgi:hypothetical protein
MNKDKIVEILSKYGLITDLTEESQEKLGLDIFDGTLYELYGTVATEILNSTQTLDRDKVEKIINKALVKSHNGFLSEEKIFNKFVNAICSLAIPEEGEVIAEGKITTKMIDLNAQSWDIPDFDFNKLVKYIGKKVKIIIKEIK